MNLATPDLPRIAFLVLALAGLSFSQSSTVLNLGCNPTGNPGEYEITWALPSPTTFSEIRIRENDIVVATLPGSATSYVGTANATQPDSCANAASIGLGDNVLSNQLPIVCVQSIFPGALDGAQVCCNPLSVLAATDGDDLSPFCDPGPMFDNQIYNDVFFCFTATSTGTLTLDFALASFFRAAVYDGCGCPADSADVLACTEEVFVSTLNVDTIDGESYLIRIGAQLPMSPVLGLLELKYDLPTPENLVCDDSVPGEVTLAWDIPAGTTYDDGIDIIRNGILIASVPGTQTQATVPLSTPLVGSEDFCIEGLSSSLGTSGFVCCTLFGPPANDTCAQATPVDSMTPSVQFQTSPAAGTDGQSLAGFCDPGPSSSDQIFNDVYYCYTADQDGFVQAQVIGADLRGAVYEGCGCPEETADLLACSETTSAGLQFTLGFAVQSGETYLLRLGTQVPGAIIDALLLVQPVASPGVLNLDCNLVAPDQVELTWDIPAGANYSGGIEISESGVVVATLPGTTTTTVYDVPAGLVGLLELCVAGIDAVGPTPAACCNVSVSMLPNDNCLSPVDVGLGLIPFDTSGATTGVLSTSCADVTDDIWYRFSPAVTSVYRLSLCASSFDTVIALFEDTGICPPTNPVDCDDDSCGPQSEVETQLEAGTDYLIQVGSPFPLPGGVGQLEIELSPAVQDLICDFDCLGQVVELGWTNATTYTEIEILANSVSIATLGGTETSFIDPNPPVGPVEYTVIATDTTFETGAVRCSLSVGPNPVSTPIADLILNLELPGAVDSAQALEEALVANGRSVLRLDLTSIAGFGCIDEAIASSDNIWVLTGSFPNQAPLGAGDLQVLVDANDLGRPLYLEGSLLWSLGLVSGPLADRDGVDDATIQFSTFVDVVEGLAGTDFTFDLSSFSNLAYESDQPGMSPDFNDELAIAGSGVDPQVLTVEPILRNLDLTGIEGDFAVTIVAENSAGANIISSSVEFGGLGTTSDRVSIAADYLQALGSSGGSEFLRGDCNVDLLVNVADAVFLLNSLFVPGSPPSDTCEDACDGNDDGSVNVADAITVLNNLFVPGSPVLPEPQGECNVDPTADGLECVDPICP